MNKHSKKFITLLVLLSISLSGCGLEALISDGIVSLYDNQRYQELIDSIDSEKLINSDDHDSMWRLSSSYYHVGLHEEALKYVNKALLIEDIMRYRILKYNILESLDYYDEQMELVADTLGGYSEDYESLSIDEKVNYCYFLILDYKNEEAIEKYEAILDEVSEIELKDTIFNNIAWASLNIRDYDKAKDYSLKSLEINPNDSITLTNLGNSYYGLSEYESAREIYIEAIENNPNNSFAVYGMANTLEELEDEAYIDYWKNYNVLQPFDFEGLQALYNYYVEISDDENSLIMLEKIVELKPGYDYYVKELMSRYSDLESHKNINNLLDNYKKVNGEYSLDVLLADYKFERFSKDEGLALYVELLNKYEIDFWDLYYIGENIYFMDDQIDGNIYFSKFVDEVNKKSNSLKGTEIEAEIYLEYGDYEGLLESARKLVKVNPSNYYGYELLADSYYELGDYNKAYENYKKAGTLTEDNFYLDISLIDSAIYINKIDEAEKLIEKIIIEHDDKPIVHVNKARIFSLRGQDEKAIESLVKAFDKSDYMDYVLDTYEELAKYKDEKRLEK